jgi:hypothetical protein
VFKIFRPEQAKYVNPNRMNGDNLKNERCVTRHMGTKKEYLKSEINEPAINSKKKDHVSLKWIRNLKNG